MGPVIAEALADRRVVEVMVNPDGKIWVDHVGEGRVFTGKLLGPSATLPETGERFQGAFMPIVANPAFAIRKRPEIIFTLDDYVREGIMTDAMAGVLREAAEARQNLLIAGGTGSEKTTLANAILAEPAFARDRVVLIEDTAELQCAAEDRLRIPTMPPAHSEMIAPIIPR